MRKAGIVLLVLLIAVSGCFAFLHHGLLGVADDVTVTRQTYYGDPAVADGVHVLVRNQYSQRLMWETALTLGEDAVPETEFIFSNERIYLYSEPDYTGLEFDVMSNHVFFFNSGRIPEYAKAKYGALAEAIQKEEQSVAEGETKTFGIDYGQYLEYYPLDGQVILPEITLAFTEFETWTTGSDEVAKAINAYFRIPLDGIYTVDYTFDRTDDARSYGASVNLDYFMNASGVATPEACYFTFNTVKEDGTVVDTSLIPGGYGIYRLPYDENGLQFDKMEMVYALDPAEKYDSMTLSDDGKRIRLHTWQGEDLMLTVIDMESMTRLQKVKLLTESEEWHYSVVNYDNFTLIVENRANSDDLDQITVWEQLPDGTFGHGFTTPIRADVFPGGTVSNLFDRYNYAVDYADGKLVVTCPQMLRYYNNWHDNFCDLYVAVYDASGMRYAGSCVWNLTRVNSTEPYADRVMPMLSDSLEVSWESPATE